MSRRSILPPPDPNNTKKSTQTANSIIKPLQNLTVNEQKKTSEKALYATGLSVSKDSCSSSRKRLSPQDLQDLSVRQQKRIRDAQKSAYLQHPYQVKLDNSKSKLQKLMNHIFDLANNDLIVCDIDTGLNDYTKNLSFADQLDAMSKELIVLSKACTDKATVIRDRIAEAKENKRVIQDIVYLTEVTKESEKCDEIRYIRPDQNFVPSDFVHTSEFRVKRERPKEIRTYYVDTTDSETEETSKGTNKKKPKVPSGDPDTKFRYTKDNDFDKLRHPNSICVLCDKVFRDKTELRNHMSNHHKEVFRCMRCGNLSRTQISFQQHLKTHTGDRFTCKVCLMIFDRKTTLTNHEQKHSTTKLVCKKCGRDFQYRGGFLEHIRYRHTDKPTCQCPICKKFYWTPTSMRSHRRKIHGLVKKLVYNETI